VGPTGADASDDGGRSWKSLTENGFNSIAFARRGDGWAVGADGVVARASRR
jgi:hypothetical protein